MPNKPTPRRTRRRPNPDPLSSMIDALNQAAYDAITQSADAFMDRIFNPSTGPIPLPNNPGPQKPKAKNPPSTPSPTLYDVLQISPHADPETITATYKSLAKRFHPDIYKGKDGDERMKQITEAYRILGNPETRKTYDRLLKRS